MRDRSAAGQRDNFVIDDAIKIEPLTEVLRHSRTQVVFGAGRLAELGALASAHGAAHVLLVTDPGIESAGHVTRGLASLKSAVRHVTVFDGVRENPTTEHVDHGVATARQAEVHGPIDIIVGFGGGSAMDCAKGINFILTNGGRMADYWGVGKAKKPMLPMIAIPTTAGTGSEAQSFALISDPVTHQKMACGDSKSLCRFAILDPELTATVPSRVAAATGIDAVAHAIETAATSRRNEVSMAFTREAWRRLRDAFPRVMRDPGDAEARALMLLGAHLAGAAIEHSMLGAAHSCANPLTARCGITHGVAVGIMLPHVVRFNSSNGKDPYHDIGHDGGELADLVGVLLVAGRLPTRLADCGVAEAILPQLAAEAAQQWTAQFNPVPVTARELWTIYRAAY